MSAYLAKDHLYSENMESIFFKKIFFSKRWVMCFVLEHLWSIHPWKLTCPLKINGWKMYFLLKWSLFVGHVNFQGCIESNWLDFHLWLHWSLDGKGFEMQIPPQSLTWNLKMMVSNRNLLIIPFRSLRFPNLPKRNLRVPQEHPLPLNTPP